MMDTPFLVLDAEAVSALANPRERGASARRAQALTARVERHGAIIRIPAAVLAELYRGGPRDAAIDRIANVEDWVVPTDRFIARLAGHLLGRRHLDSRHAIDALVVATAITLAPSVVVTGDPDDLKALASGHPNVEVVALR